MNSIISRTLWVGALAGALTCVGCALILDWDQEGLPCEEGACADGYSCRAQQCILNRSVEKKGTCYLDIQCQGKLVCANFKCATSCSVYSSYESTKDCEATEYCKEQHLSKEGEGGKWRGYCESGDSCEGGASCGGDRKCVEITSTANACLVGCDIQWAVTKYDGTCKESSGKIQYCQPLGKNNRLVCRETKKEAEAQQVGQLCDLAGKPCKRGLACIEGYCRKYCFHAFDQPDSVDDQCGAKKCCDQGDYAYCHRDCG